MVGPGGFVCGALLDENLALGVVDEGVYSVVVRTLGIGLRAGNGSYELVVLGVAVDEFWHGCIVQELRSFGFAASSMAYIFHIS